MKQILGYLFGFMIFILGIPSLMWLVAGRPEPSDLPILRMFLGVLIALVGLALSIWSIVYMKRVGKGNLRVVLDEFEKTLSERSL